MIDLGLDDKYLLLDGNNRLCAFWIWVGFKKGNTFEFQEPKEFNLQAQTFHPTLSKSQMLDIAGGKNVLHKAANANNLADMVTFFLFYF